MVILFQLLLVYITNVASNPNVYDQRQSGKTNVRVEVKDAVIIAIADGEFGGDYDYNYDYSDLTVKPILGSSTPQVPASFTPPAPPKSTTLKSTTVLSTSTGTFNLTQNAGVVLEAENNSIIFPSPPKPSNSSTNSIKIPPNSFKPGQIPVLVLQETPKPNKFLPVKTVEKQYLSSSHLRGKVSNTSSINPEDLPPRHCSPGFFLDNHNRCKRIRRPTRERPQLPIGLRFDHRPLTRS